MSNKNESYIQALGFKKLRKISFGLFASLFLFWAIFNNSSFVPEGQELKFTLGFLGYGILGSYVFAREDFRSQLSKISLFKSIPIFFITFIPSLIVLAVLLGIRDPLPSVFISVLVGVPLYLQIMNSLIFATIESSFFQFFLDRKIGILGSFLFAGLMHAPIWSGSLFFNFVGASFLFLVFSTLHFYFRKKFGDLQAIIMIIAFHTAYNFIQLKLILGT